MGNVPCFFIKNKHSQKVQDFLGNFPSPMFHNCKIKMYIYLHVMYIYVNKYNIYTQYPLSYIFTEVYLL